MVEKLKGFWMKCCVSFIIDGLSWNKHRFSGIQSFGDLKNRSIAFGD
jgi:hypothetical protein